MDVLLLGGGIFLGASLVDAALARGHRLTVFNRGRSRTDWPAGVEAIVGDRHRDLGLLAGRHVDAVIDTCGYVPAELRASTAALAACRRYCFVSSISAYASMAHAPVRESDPLASSDGIAEDDPDRARHYGPQKAASERIVSAAFGERALIVRPGLIVGPGDRTGRFSYWPWRALAGGEILVPDVSGDEPIQVIDVRDLADWIVRAVEAGASGAFNATGPQDGRPCGWAEVLEACIDGARRRGGSPLRVVPVGEAFLLAQGIAPWNELPLWLPSSDPDHLGFGHVDCSRAVAAGLVTRPLADTVDAVLDEFPTLGDDDPRRRGKLTRDRERELIARWRKRAPAGDSIAATRTS
ncbi:MAG TPA: NAD-dependent epimerase/dehydratase family protein [Caldimonas sp.]|nr:NAD-dependent epimerase/dehydratase family protein [Caldimonas sp.]